MDELTEAHGWLKRCIELLTRAQHHAPDRVQPLLSAVLTNLEGCEISIEDIQKMLDRETAR